MDISFSTKNLCNRINKKFFLRHLSEFDSDADASHHDNADDDEGENKDNSWKDFVLLRQRASQGEHNEHCHDAPEDDAIAYRTKVTCVGELRSFHNVL